METDQVKKSRKQIDILDFLLEMGDLTPLQEFKGPRVPSRRQTLRHFLYFLVLGLSLIDAGNKVVENVLKKHPTKADQAKTPKRIRDDVIALYKNARLIFVVSVDLF